MNPGPDTIGAKMAKLRMLNMTRMTCNCMVMRVITIGPDNRFIQFIPVLAIGIP